MLQGIRLKQGLEVRLEGTALSMEAKVTWHKMNLCPMAKHENTQPLLEEVLEQKQKTVSLTTVKLLCDWCQINYLRFLLIIKRKMRMCARNVGTMAVMENCVQVSKLTPSTKISKINLRWPPMKMVKSFRSINKA